jgi:protein dithiol:quinone oxidoreductase
MNDQISSRRSLNLAGFAACAGLMAYALYAQHGLGLEPCPLCIFQRVAVIVLGLVFLLAAIHNPQRRGARVYGVLLGTIALGGAGVAAHHVRVQNLPAGEIPACGPGLDYMLDTFPLRETLALVFRGSGDCGEADWAFAGLSMPGWVLVACLALGAFAVWNNWRTGAAPAPAGRMADSVT